MLAKLILGIIVTVFLSACGSSNSKNAVTTISSSLSRIENPSVDTNSTDVLVEGLNSFAFDLYPKLKKGNEGENLFFSPISISTALAMVYPGAVGDTKSEMASTLHFNMEEEQLLNTFNALDTSLNKENESYIFKEVNALWPDKTFEFKVTYLDAIMQNFGAGLYPLDFVHNPKEARLRINEWVEEQTNDKIVELLKEENVTPLTRLVLTNAVYFNGKWENDFYESSTKEESFYLLNNTSIKTPMMQQTKYFKYGESNHYKSLELPYKDSNASMLIVLPDEGYWESFVSNFNLATYHTIIEQMSGTNVELKFPKFKFETPQYPLKTSLKDLGMLRVFEDEADFSNMAYESIKIGDVLHKAYISVDENGTEAAAATAAVMVDITSAVPSQEEIKPFYVNRPFIIFIRDTNTNQILFMGEILDPK